MSDFICIIVGGGHVGMRALKAIKETTQGTVNGRRIRFVLFDKKPGHVRKVMLFRPAVGDEGIVIPWTHWFPEGVELVQGTVTSVDSGEKRIRYTDAQGNDVRIHYDLLVIAVGSIVRRPDPEQGGIALTDLQAALDIREHWRANLRKAVDEANPDERKRLLTVAVAGAGISGIETSTELVSAMKKEASSLGLDSATVSVHLLNARERLFPEGPAKVGRKLEQALNGCGVNVLHRHTAVQEEDGVVTIQGGNRLSVGLCIWTIGLLPNPDLRRIGLPLTPEGQVLVDECYRVQGAPGVYSLGDCARIVDLRTGKADQMTCKEGLMQATRLGKIVMADLEGRPAPAHKSMVDLFCIGLGQNHGLVWIRKWGVDLLITGRLAWKFKRLTWDLASMLR